MANNHPWHGFRLILCVLINFSYQKTQEKTSYMAVSPKTKNISFSLHRVCQKWPILAKNHVWHGFRLILGVLIDFLCQKTQEKTPYIAILLQNKKYITFVAPCVPKMVNFGQKSCLAWFQACIRGFNRFLVPKSIENDTQHAHINL